MRRFTLTTVLGTGLALTAGLATAEADCSFDNRQTVKISANSFEAWKVVTDAMAECGNVQAELDTEYRTKQPTAFSANPSLYHLGGVTNSTIIPLLNEDLIRPLDDLVAQYGEQLSPNQLIRVNGEVVAVAMMINTQHLMYRNDIFEQLDLDVPQTWDQVLGAAEVIRDAGVVEYPLGGTFQTGWNLGEEFVNMYLGYGGEFFDGSEPAINNEAGVKSLEMLKALTEYMDPEYLVSDSTYVQQQFQQGKIAMANLWASRATAMNNEAESQVVGKVSMAAAPAAYEGGKPATTLWWDGVVVAKNLPDDAAANAFRVALEGMDREMVQNHNDVAIWLIQGYQPGPLSEGAAASANGGAPGYPARTEMGLMHTALGNNVADFLTGKKSARDTLEAIETAYRTAAREQGLL